MKFPNNLDVLVSNFGFLVRSNTLYGAGEDVSNSSTSQSQVSVQYYGDLTEFNPKNGIIVRKNAPVSDRVYLLGRHTRGW